MSNPVIEYHQTQFFTLLTGFRCFLTPTDPYRIWSRGPFCEPVNSQRLLSYFFFLTKTSCSILIWYLRRFSRVPHASSPFVLTPFAMTGRPGSPNLKRIPTPSTVVTETGVQVFHSLFTAQTYGEPFLYFSMLIHRYRSHLWSSIDRGRRAYIQQPRPHTSKNSKKSACNVSSLSYTIPF